MNFVVIFIFSLFALRSLSVFCFYFLVSLNYSQRPGEENYKNKLQQYEQEFLKTVEQEYPLSRHAREQINIWRQSLKLRNEDIRQIEQPILAAKYQEKQKKEEIQRQKEQEAKRAKQPELQKREDYENRLKQYKQEFVRSIQRTYPLDEDDRNRLKSLQQSLGLRIEDVEDIEQPLIIVAKQNLLLEAERQKREEKKQHPRNISSSTLPKPAGFLSSKKGRRSVLLGSSILGLFLIFLSQTLLIHDASSFLFLFFGDGIIMVGGICVWIGSKEERISTKWSINIDNMFILSSGWSLLWYLMFGWWKITGLIWNFLDWGALEYYEIQNNFQEMLFPGLIIYLISIYIGRW